MRLLNTKDPDMSLILIPWFIPSNRTYLETGWSLHERLRETPEDTFCCVAIEKGIIKAVLIAYVDEGHVHIWQARTSVGFKYQNTMLFGLITWSKTKGYSKLTAGVPEKNKRKFYERRYGFKYCGNNRMERRI